MYSNAPGSFGFPHSSYSPTVSGNDASSIVFITSTNGTCETTARRSFGFPPASAKFTTWLYRIATNLAVNHARDNRHERPENTVRLDEPDQETGTTPDLADESLTAEEQIMKRERLAAIRNVVNALPERQRVAVIMHKYQQMDYRQIAGVLKLSESATKSLLFRAYETLREQLKPFVSGK